MTHLNDMERLLITLEAKHVESCVVADCVEVELGTNNVGQVEVRGEHALLIIRRTGQQLAQGTDDRPRDPRACANPPPHRNPYPGDSP